MEQVQRVTCAGTSAATRKDSTENEWRHVEVSIRSGAGTVSVRVDDATVLEETKLLGAAFVHDEKCSLGLGIYYAFAQTSWEANFDSPWSRVLERQHLGARRSSPYCACCPGPCDAPTISIVMLARVANATLVARGKRMRCEVRYWIAIAPPQCQ
jgi:hypothetical protein